MAKLKHIIVAISIPNFRIFHKVVTERHLEKSLFRTDGRTDAQKDRQTDMSENSSQLFGPLD